MTPADYVRLMTMQIEESGNSRKAVGDNNVTLAQAEGRQDTLLGETAETATEVDNAPESPSRTAYTDAYCGLTPEVRADKFHRQKSSLSRCMLYQEIRFCCFILKCTETDKSLHD